MKHFKLYSISDEYIRFLRKDPKLQHVFDNKENCRTHNRKYLGAVFEKNGLFYFIPLSSPKASDFFRDKNNQIQIRKSIPAIIRMTEAKNSSIELIGTLKISNMIPVPLSELELYDTSKETDKKYLEIVKKEIIFIRKNSALIHKNANVVYNQKCYAEDIATTEQSRCPGYIDFVLPFRYAEQKCLEYISIKDITNKSIPSTQNVEKNESNNLPAPLFSRAAQKSFSEAARANEPEQNGKGRDDIGIE